ncbi:GIN domain-containing protein [Candidatus Viadribacter manganicus]|uniref:Putative auto-transporter adhesin head GIN domain-containing protein n=1 Tax=Candidatus Viadribacter manganicus TaxID=1759059 RepID=A0A1B1ADA0_9PROT|nr:DUF2807 domain-containing protein [Candidatus Viadribacter manganicus]ANP44531.1 hypothetical protein ATE48_00625 [Candidatus Viadribacter manganicus]
MRSTLITAAALVALVSSAHAQTRNLSNFSGVSAADRIHVEVSQGENYRVEVFGSDASRVQTRVDNDGTLEIRRTNRPFWGETPPIDATVRVTMPTVRRLASSRGAELTASNIAANSMSLAAAMGGELRVNGTCTNVSAAASMGGSIRAEGFECRDANIDASMGGDARVFASNRFDAAASMGGAVNVSGGGRSSNISTSMGGSVESR